MRTVKAVLLAAAAVLLAACVPSIHPLYTEEDATFEPKLLGTWVEENDPKQTWELQKAEGIKYAVTFHEEDKRVELEGRLVRLEKFLFLDLYRPEPDVFQIPAHTFVQAWLDGDSVRAAMLDPTWLKKALDSGRTSIAHMLFPAPGSSSGLRTEPSEDIALTASTKELRAFLLKHAENREAFSPQKMRRKG